MADGLDISGGTTVVSTDDLDRAVEQLGRLSEEAGLFSTRLAMLEVPSDGWDAQQARVDVEVASRELAAVAHRARMLQVLVATAARGYEYQEAAVAAGLRYLGSSASQLLGRVIPTVALGAGLASSLAAGLFWGLRAAGGVGSTVGRPFETQGVPAGSPWAKENNRLWTNPATVSALRGLVQNLGPALLAAGGVPLGVPQALGTIPYRVGARGIVALGRPLGLLAETPVRLVDAADGPVAAAPEGFADRLERVPYVEGETGPQVVIERYELPGEADRFSVYVTGTVTFTPGPTTEPWDMTSNVVNASGELSGSVASVMAAMAEAGIDEHSPVQLTGYSQGGGIVACLAASQQYNLQGLTAFGGPTGQIPIPPDVPAVIVEHSDDLVPATGGEQDNAAAVLVTREVFGGVEVPEDYAVPAHHIEYYLETARLMEESGSPRLADALSRLNGFTEGATLVSSTAYRYEREG